MSQTRLKDPVTWALHIANHPHHSVADVIREVQVEALHFGVEAGKQEFLKYALDTDKRISKRLSATSADNKPT